MPDEVIKDFELDFSADSVAEDIDEQVGESFVEFGRLRLAAAKNVTLFQKGASISIPTVTVNGEPFSRGGIQEGGPTKAYFFEFLGKTKTLEDFTSVKIFTTMANIPITKDSSYPIKPDLSQKQTGAIEDEKTAWISDWSQLQYPSLKASLSPQQLTDLSKGKPFYFSAKTWNTGRKPFESTTTFKEDGTPKKYYEQFWYDFTIYQNEAEMLKAKDAHWESDSSEDLGDFWPKSWAEDLPGMVDWAKRKATEITEPVALAKELNLSPDDEAINGEKVSPTKVLSVLLDKPEPMVKV
jgi:hypothetical protein